MHARGLLICLTAMHQQRTLPVILFSVQEVLAPSALMQPLPSQAQQPSTTTCVSSWTPASLVRTCSAPCCVLATSVILPSVAADMLVSTLWRQPLKKAPALTVLV